MSASLLDHLWQSTLVALCAWLLATWLRKHSARLRHAIWLAASLKFLLPFSLLAAAGEWLATRVTFAAVPGLGFEQAGIASLIAAPASNSMRVESLSELWLGLVGVLWGAGFIALVVRWGVRLSHIRKLVKSAQPLFIAAPIPVMASRTLREPGVIGVFHPVLMLPAGIEQRLTAPQLDAIVAHELCHVRRRDNLSSALHMLVEALFWFFPPVWWIGARMLDERERACDEAVLRAGNDPRDYAEGILKVCRSYWASNLPCVAGVSGADLKSRLEAIMKNETSNPLSRRGKILLALLAGSALLVPLGVGMAAGDTPKVAEVAQAGKISVLPGKRVKLKYQNVDVRSLIGAMSEAGQVNILVSDQVKGTVTLDLAEMPWDQAFDIILRSQGLSKREQNGILFIEPAAEKAG